MNSYALTPALLNSMILNTNLLNEFAPLKVLKRSLDILTKHSCNCGGGAAGNRTKKLNEAYNMAKMNIVNMTSDDKILFKKKAGLENLEVSYTNNKGITVKVNL